MSETTQHQIDAMKTMAQELDPQVVKSAHVDDWGRYGNFTLHVTPVTHTRGTTASLKALVRKMLPEGSHLRECFPPEPRYAREYRGAKPIKKYHATFWVFDIDFQHYNAESNSFSLSATA
jgi:hypothetical protein